MSREFRAIVLLAVASCWLAGCPTSTGGYISDCTPKCQGKVCGDDGCGGQCGVCGEGEDCNSGLCTPVGPPVDVIPEVESWWEVRVPDGTPEQVCDSLFDQYHSLLQQAGACDTSLDCSHLVENRLACTCAHYVSDPSVELGLAEVSGLYDSHHCLEGTACGACPWLEMPACPDGSCAATTPVCSELKVLYQGLAKMARACDADSLCTGMMPMSLECTCDVPANGSVWTGYFDIALEYWTTSECGQPEPCECDDTGKVGCVNGQCGYEPAVTEGSTDCDTDDDCFPLGGCDCGCWSQAPINESSDVECACEAPASCLCIDEQCQGGR